MPEAIHVRRTRGNPGLISIRSRHSPVVLEPSEELPWSRGLVWAEIFEEADLPFIILADTDLDYTVDATPYGAFLHKGKLWMCARRPIAAESLVRFAEKAAGLAHASG